MRTSPPPKTPGRPVSNVIASALSLPRAATTLAWCYPVITFIVIIITANHYILDAVAGLLILAIGWFVAKRVTRAGRSDPLIDPGTPSPSLPAS